MNKLDSLYFKALKAAAKTRRASSGGRRIPAAERAAVMKTAKRSARSKYARLRMAKDSVTIDDLAKDFGLPAWDDIYEMNVDSYIGDGAYRAEKEALSEGASEEEAEQARDKAEQELLDEVYANWYDAVLYAVETVLEKQGLKLVGKRVRRRQVNRPHELKIVPEKSWKDAAQQILETLNGVGVFHFNSLKEFLDSGPYTARDAALRHLHWAKDYPAVYGGTSVRRLYENHWR